MQSLVERELVKGINEEAQLLRLEMAALQKEAMERSRVRNSPCRARLTRGWLLGHLRAYVAADRKPPRA